MKLTRRQSLHLMGTAFAAPFLSRRARAVLAVEADPRDRSGRRRQHHRHHLAHRVRAAFAATRPADHHGEPARRRRHYRRRRRRARRTGRLHLFSQLVTTLGHAGVLSECPYDTARDLAAVAALGSSPNVMVASPAKGFKTLRDLVTAAKAKSGGLCARHAGCRLRGASQRRAVSPERWLRGRPCAVPRHAGSAHRGHDRARWISPAPASHPRCRSFAMASSWRLRLPRRNARRRCPTCRRRSRPATLIPTTRSGPGMFLPAKTPREIVERLHQETQKALRAPGVRGEARPAGHRSDADHTGGVRRADQDRDRQYHCAGEGRRH